MIGCKECFREHRNWNECAGKPYYSWGDFVFCSHQMEWAIKHLEELKVGHWPDDPDKLASGYTDFPNVETQVKTEADFVKPCLIAAEVERRLDRTGKDGDYVRTRYSETYKSFTDFERVARAMNLSVEELERITARVLSYISGWDWRDKEDYRR